MIKKLCAALCFLLCGLIGASLAETLQLPEETTAIEAQAFEGDASVGSVVLPAKLKRIGARAFAGTALRDVALPASLEYIAPDAFDDIVVFSVTPGTYAAQWVSDNHKTLNGEMPEGIVYEADPSDPLGRIMITGYEGEASSIEIPGAVGGIPVYRIGDEAFINQTALVSVTLPRTLEIIGMQAFNGCDHLQEMILPDSILSIGEYAFGNCDAMTRLVLPAAFEHAGCTIFPAKKLRQITMSVSADLADAFSGTPPLEIIHYVPGSTGVMPDYNKTSSGLRLEAKCSKTLTTLDFGEGITHIGAYAYYKSSSGSLKLATIHFPSTLQSIGEHAFENQAQLQAAVFPDSLNSIGAYSFTGCTSLESVTFPTGLKLIGDYAFANCVSLVVPDVPVGTVYNETVFEGCITGE